MLAPLHLPATYTCVHSTLHTSCIQLFKSPPILPTHTACVHSVHRCYNWMASHHSVRGRCRDRGTHHKPPGDLGRQPIASLRLEWQGSQGHLLQSPLHPGGKDAVGFTSMAPPPCVHLPLLLCTRKALDCSTLIKLLSLTGSKIPSTVLN